MNTLTLVEHIETTIRATAIAVHPSLPSRFAVGGQSGRVEVYEKNIDGVYARVNEFEFLDEKGYASSIAYMHMDEKGAIFIGGQDGLVALYTINDSEEVSRMPLPKCVGAEGFLVDITCGECIDNHQHMLADGEGALHIYKKNKAGAWYRQDVATRRDDALYQIRSLSKNICIAGGEVGTLYVYENKGSGWVATGELSLGESIYAIAHIQKDTLLVGGSAGMLRVVGLPSLSTQIIQGEVTVEAILPLSASLCIIGNDTGVLSVYENGLRREVARIDGPIVSLARLRNKHIIAGGNGGVWVFSVK